MAHMREFNLYSYLLEESYQNGYLILPYHLRLCALTWYYFDPNIFVLRYLAIHHYDSHERIYNVTYEFITVPVSTS